MRAIFAGGGTGGHLFPALAIADELRKLDPGAEILFAGTRDKLEARIVPEKGYAFRPIWISGFRRSIRIENLLFPVKVIVSVMQAISLVKEFKPAVVVGTGGYVSGPVLYAATLLGVPTLIQEQNSYPGVTTRLLAGRVDEVHLSFESTRNALRRAQGVFVSGNPTRDELESVTRDESLEYFGFDKNERKKTILIFGGSLGAHSINLAVERHLDWMIDKGMRVIWQTGKEFSVRAASLCARYHRNDVWVSAFIDRMEYAYNACDLAVCRAGATTIAELTRLGKPALLIPYPHAAADHQTENARTLTESGAADLLPDHEVMEKLPGILPGLLSDSRLGAMAVQSRKLGKPGAARGIAQRVLGLAMGSGMHAGVRSDRTVD